MSINKKLIYKTLLTIVGVIILAAGGLMAYLVIPSGFQSRQAEGPKVLTELLKMAQKSQSFNPDPYISSTYRPGDPLYEPLLYIQRHRQGKAEELLKPLVEQGNPDAMYWLAQITYDDSYYSSGPAAKLFQKSAELGNPYAALRLDSNNRECQMFMSGYCDQKWGKLGRKLLQERAAQGDKKAEYYLLQYDENSSEEVHKELERLVTENAKNHYYQPLMNLIYDYYNGSYLTFFKKGRTPTEEDKKTLIKIALIPAHNNFPPAIFNVIYSMIQLIPDNDALNIIKHNIYTDSNSYVCRSYYSEINNKIRDNIIRGAACAIEEDMFINDHLNMDRYTFSLKQKNIKPLTTEELDKAKYIANEILKNKKTVIYIDEMNTRP
ncbi:tetratricopeptide repeat protein [Vibrio gazogenes]|uniref:Uncharacterized protein n=1 Tax=Vibrio gazogenes DSM 21264 = NBRC 103151 TaxID=1123492 RepID=A0A1M5BXZ8_VIBGA|nr:hypothetical protein [Vibrio gazogenes]USP13609.1 hypothetical protein MKS89_14740 [Vibrio gazogenes]SHF47250.1 hypothetical protein SAMN02745781_02394 [Vibrio gazogenes DSM 21264] [Vibrio gazogenes DSM 21264 = NBRC 103151]SJN55651.1 hypothetical protein BQ6471_01649 [Vibrio gazogenes]